MVINDIGKMIRRIPVRLHQHKVLLGLLLLKRPVDGVLELGCAKEARVEAHDVSFPGRGTGVGLGAREGAAGARVRGGLAGIVKGALLGLEVVGGAEAAVGGAVVQERLGVLAVCVEAFRLGDVIRISELDIQRVRRFTCRYGP